MATYSYGNAPVDRRPYMAKIPDRSLRELPSDKGQQQYTAESKADILKIYGVGDYEYISQNSAEKDKPKWRDSDVQNVVDYYLKSATHGGNPQEPQPAIMCECCMDINDVNKRHRRFKTIEPNPVLKDDHPKEGSRPNSPEEVPRAPPGGHPKEVRFVGMWDKVPVVPAIPFYRSEHEGPELIADTTGLSYPEQKQTLQQYDDFLTENKKVFMTHPVKKSLYSSWGVNEEVGWFDKDRHMAEGVVEASSKYIESMQRLKRHGDNENLYERY